MRHTKILSIVLTSTLLITALPTSTKIFASESNTYSNSYIDEKTLDIDCSKIKLDYNDFSVRKSSMGIDIPNIDENSLEDLNPILDSELEQLKVHKSNIINKDKLTR